MRVFPRFSTCDFTPRAQGCGLTYRSRWRAREELQSSMRVIVAHQSTGVLAPVVRDRDAAVGGNYRGVEVHHTLAGDCSRHTAHAMRRVTGRAGEAVIDMVGVPAEAGVVNDLVQVVALGAHCVRSRDAQVGIREQIGYRSAGNRCLAELVAPFENMPPRRSVRTIRSHTAKFTIVVEL